MFKQQYITETGKPYSYQIFCTKYNEHREVICNHYFEWLFDYCDKLIEKTTNR